MAVFKCKICGEALDPTHSVATCEYCGTKQTIPRLGDERRANLYDRANHFRRNNDFDKAMAIYETILNEDLTDAEAYWSIVLCRYGIEYVKDPATRRHVPTVNRAQYTSIFDDEDYKSAIANADDHQRELYEAEAAAINEIQKGILAISQKESPFDVFICYKETDANGRRTHDSVLAQELYYQLKQEGFKVFFSRITLEDKLGSAYEPYIFAALNSAKVMVVLGTAPEHFNAVWVKNEWSRYLSLIKNGAKKVLIPAYRDMDPYDLPEEFSHLQAQDMSKLGFMQDLVRGIRKLAGSQPPKTAAPVKETIIETAAAVNVTALLRRVFLFLEDGEFDNANEYCEKVLDQDPENGEAYLGKLMVELRIKNMDDLPDYALQFEKNTQYHRVLRFGDDKLKEKLKGYVKIANQNRYRAILEKAKSNYEALSTEPMEKRLEGIQSLIASLREHESHPDVSAFVRQLRVTASALERVINERREEEERRALEKEFQKLRFIPTKEEMLRSAQALLQKLRSANTSCCFDLIMRCEGLIGELQEAVLQERRNAEPRLLPLLPPVHMKKIKRSPSFKTMLIVAVVMMLVGGIVLAAFSVYSASKYEYQNGLTYVKVDDEFVLEGVDKTISGKVVIPAAIKGVRVAAITSGAFSDCKNLTSIELPNTIKIIEEGTFLGCSSLTSVTMGSVTSIEKYAFGECKSLTSIELPASLAKIGEHAFKECTNLGAVIVPASVKAIGLGAFENCNNLTSISVPFVGKELSKELISKEGVTPMISNGHFGYIFGAETSEENGQYVPHSLKIVTVSGSNVIARNAFANCGSIESIFLPATIECISPFAFAQCTNLRSITIGSGSRLSQIGNNAFEGCDAWESLICDAGPWTVSGRTMELTVENLQSETYGNFYWYCSNSSKDTAGDIFYE